MGGGGRGQSHHRWKPPRRSKCSARKSGGYGLDLTSLSAILSSTDLRRGRSYPPWRALQKGAKARLHQHEPWRYHAVFSLLLLRGRQCRKLRCGRVAESVTARAYFRVLALICYNVSSLATPFPLPFVCVNLNEQNLETTK